ncbi:MAG: 50S ribosomal protein L19e [Candidatus Nezhaarchaeota archaeon]|nr:50S ribosomal protein L19e [Candidatus Nezhaarchaeota archaeon]
MSTIHPVKKMAAELLGVGINRVWMDPDQLDKISSAITKEDVRKLIKEGLIKARPVKGTSRSRKKERHKQRRKGLRKGPGSKKGQLLDKKRAWIAKVRALRKVLAEFRRKKLITKQTYRRLYVMVKSGTFHNKSQLKMYIKEKGLIRAPL